ncbi:hypothetical protein BBK36DRAFT_1160432 [Trichoderma citrinoviride]|uniref:Uncharacterized protein n=1 Tax=Trichoderma citrinoviride TaxID=58853 RepID=A0A2T4B7P0_9HYPO|nr:hypothetical protein BBK36DRAFT_1160432 [Trichoderma citrinoviride]PTB65231.1 hypothetical protein BBK36DRAFT_1160432 [Trichoderma citrinoviride]
MTLINTSEPSWPIDHTNQEPIPLASRIVHKFFEPIILLVALVDAVRNTAKPRPPEQEINVQDPTQLFCAFVNKLGHVCDREKGGETVTSFVVLQSEADPQRAHYVFAVNKQTDSQLSSTATYVRTLLRKVGQAPEGQENQRDARRSLLYHVLRFNRPRVSVYLRKLRAQAASCLEKCQSDMTDENISIAEQLGCILDISETGSNVKDALPQYIQQCETTMQLLVRIDSSPAGKIIEERAQEDRIVGYRSMECWAELLHTMRRILAYQQSVQFFLQAKEKWPSLFQNATVDFLASSRPVPKPIRNKSLSAVSIVGRMTRKEKVMRIFQRFAQDLQAFDLDDRIKQEYGRTTFRPTVHAEVLLLDWVWKQSKIAPLSFFNDCKYIGSSKPTCKLCDFYFQEHKYKIGHRISHGNLYSSWRVPDVFPYQGQACIDDRQIMVDRLLQRVRKEAFDIVQKKAPVSVKAEDSLTNSARMTLFDIVSLRASTAPMDDLASLLGQVDIS